MIQTYERLSLRNLLDLINASRKQKYAKSIYKSQELSFTPIANLMRKKTSTTNNSKQLTKRKTTKKAKRKEERKKKTPKQISNKTKTPSDNSNQEGENCHN